MAPQQRCLDERRVALGQLTGRLAAPDENTALHAAEMAGSLPPIADCESPGYLEGITAAVETDALAAARERLAQANLHYLAESDDAAKPLLAEVIAAARTAGDRRLEAEALVLRGRIEKVAGEHGVAAETLRGAVEAARDAPHVRVEAWINLASVMQQLGRPEQADEALAQAQRSLAEAPDRRREVRLYNIQGTVLGMRGQHQEALPYYQRALSIDIADPMTEQMLHRNIAIPLRRLDRLDGAIRHTRRALELQENAFGPDHPEVGRARRQLGSLLGQAGHYPDAHRELDRAVAIADRVHGERPHADRAGARGSYGFVLSVEGRHHEAVDYLRKAVAMYDAIEPNARQWWSTRTDLGAELIEIGALDEADQVLTPLLAARVAALGPDHPDVARTRSQLARVWLGRGRIADAIAGFEDARRIFAARFAADHSTVAEMLVNLAAAHGSAGRRRKALQLGTKALQIRRTALPPGHGETLEALRLVLDDHLALGDTAGALALLDQAPPAEQRGALQLARDARDALAARTRDRRAARQASAIDRWLATSR